MKYRELIQKMEPAEAAFRALTQVRGGMRVYCFNCAYWNEIAGRWQCGMPSEEVNCRKVFEQWLDTEAE